MCVIIYMCIVRSLHFHVSILNNIHVAFLFFSELHIIIYVIDPY